MAGITVTLYQIGRQFLGTKELPGAQHEPFIQWGHKLCGLGIGVADEVPWCSSFLVALAFLLGLPRSKSAAARSWLTIGAPVALDDAICGFDVVVLERGTDGVSGHVGLYVSHDERKVRLLGGNQSNAVTEQEFDRFKVLGVRRLV